MMCSLITRNCAFWHTLLILNFAFSVWERRLLLMRGFCALCSSLWGSSGGAMLPIFLHQEELALKHAGTQDSSESFDRLLISSLLCCSQLWLVGCLLSTSVGLHWVKNNSTSIYLPLITIDNKFYFSFSICLTLILYNLSGMAWQPLRFIDMRDVAQYIHWWRPSTKLPQRGL